MTPMLMTPGEQPGRGVEAALHHEVPGAEQPRGLPRPAVPRRATRTQHREQQHAAGCFNFDIYAAAVQPASTSAAFTRSSCLHLKLFH